MSEFVRGNVETIVENKAYQSGVQYDAVVAGKQFKTFVKTGAYRPSEGDEVVVNKSKNAKGYDDYTVMPSGGAVAPTPTCGEAVASAATGGRILAPKTQATINYWAGEERAIQKLDSIVRNNIAMIVAGKDGGMTLSMLKHLTTVDGFMAQVAEMTRIDLDVIEDIENFNGELPKFTPPSAE